MKPEPTKADKPMNPNKTIEEIADHIRSDFGLTETEAGDILDLFHLAKEQGRREGAEEIKQYLEKVYVEKWNDADHCSCLPYTIHELFCPHCTDETPVAFCKYPDNPTEE